MPRQIPIHPALVLACALVMGCAVHAPDRGYVSDNTDADGALLDLAARGELLQLLSAPADPAYVGVYPNPEEAERMVIHLGPGGELRAVCEAFGTRFDCRANPFHSLVQRLPDGSRSVEVRDLHGHLVAEVITRAEPEGSASRDPARTSPSEGEERGSEGAAPAYTGEVGVVVDSFEGSFAGAPSSLAPGVPVRATAGNGSPTYLRVEIGEHVELPREDEGGELDGSPTGLRGYVHGTWTAGELSDLMVNFNGNGRGYTAGTTRWYGGAITRVAREPAADGVTWRLVVDAAWPDESWARLVVRYNAGSTAEPGPMAPLAAIPPPSWAAFRDPCSLPAEKARFCDGVNAELSASGQSYRLDCAALPDHPAGRAPNGRSEATATDPPFDGCMQVMREPLSAIGAHAPTSVCHAALVSVWEDYGRFELVSNGMCLGSPIVLDLDGDGIALSDPEGGVAFDLFGEGRAVQTAWPAGDDDAFLVLDRDADGFVAGAAELFGHATAGGRHADGFEPLAALDADGDGVLDASDAAFADLAVWIDADRDGSSDRGEVRALADVGVISLSVRPRHVEGDAARDAHGNELALTAEFTLVGGREGTMADAFLRYRPLASEATPPASAVVAEPATAPSQSAFALSCVAR